MPSNTSNSGGDKSAVPQNALHPAKKVLHPIKKATPSVQSAAPLHFHPSQIPWLWLGLTAAIMVGLVLGFFAYNKFKIGRKPSLGKRNSRMTTIGNKVNLCESLYTLKTNFCNRKNAKSEQYRKYFETLRELQKDSESLLNDAEKRAFKNCIDTCSESVKTTNKLAMHGPQTLVKYGVAMGNTINALIDNLSPSQNSNAASRPASFRNFEEPARPQHSRHNSEMPPSIETREAASLSSGRNSLELSLNRANNIIKARDATIADLKGQLGGAGNKVAQLQSRLDMVQADLKEEQTNTNNWQAKVKGLEKQSESQEDARQNLESLTSPVHARTSLPQDAAPWSELGYYVQSLLKFAVLIDQGDNTAATSKLKDLQRVLFGPPPMNSLFDPERPAPVDVFARILYLQSDLRAKLREQNILVIMPAIGEKFDAQHHECAEADLVWDHDDPSKHNTIYSVRTIGFENRATGHILKKAIVRKQMFDGTLPPEKTEESLVAVGAPSEASLLKTPDFPVSELVFESEVTKQDLAPTAASLEPTPEIAPETSLASADNLPAPMPTEVSAEVSLKAEMTPVTADSREEEIAVVDSTLADDNALTDPSEERKQRIAETIGEPV